MSVWPRNIAAVVALGALIFSGATSASASFVADVTTDDSLISDSGAQLVESILEGSGYHSSALAEKIAGTVGVPTESGPSGRTDYLAGEGEELSIIRQDTETDLSVGFSIPGTETTSSEDGSLEAQGAEAERFVAHSTVGGGQILYVMEDGTAAPQFTLDVDLPEGTEWVAQDGGSYTLNHDELGPILVLDAPWAVDASGTEVDTHFIFEANQITQVIDTRGAQFPIVADPSFWWYAGKAVGCIASIGALALGAAKLAQIGAKVFNLLKNAKSGTKLYKAFTQWKKLGSSNGARLKALLSAIKSFASAVAKHGFSKAKEKILAAGGRNKAGLLFIISGAGVVSDVIGVSDCVSLITGKD